MFRTTGVIIIVIIIVVAVMTTTFIIARITVQRRLEGRPANAVGRVCLFSQFSHTISGVSVAETISVTVIEGD